MAIPKRRPGELRQLRGKTWWEDENDPKSFKTFELTDSSFSFVVHDAGTTEYRGTAERAGADKYIGQIKWQNDGQTREGSIECTLTEDHGTYVLEGKWREPGRVQPWHAELFE